jgi:SagB-type dehydrogenase family enzyme
LRESAGNLLAQDTVLVMGPEFVLIPTEDGVILDGGREPELLNGPLALSLLPVLLPLIDGTRTYADLLELTPDVPLAHMRELIESLISWGVLASSNEVASRPPEMRNTLSFLKRGDAETDLKKAAEFLAHKEIFVVFEQNSQPIALMVANGLRSNGFGKIKAIAVEDLASLSIGDGGILVSIFNGTPDSADAKEFYGLLQASKASWLRTSLNISNGTGEIGPIFRPESGLCFSCLTRPLPPHKRDTPVGGTEVRSLWSALLASELTAQLLQSSRSCIRSYRRFYLPLFQHEVRTWPSAATCMLDHCDAPQTKPRRFATPSLPNQLNLLPFFFEESIASRQDVAESLASNHDSAKPGFSAKLMLNSAHIALSPAEISLSQPVIDLLLSRWTGRNSQLDLATISSMLALSVGLKQGSSDSSRRWAPSGGNLGSVEAYLVARQVEGLDAGVYLYNPDQHALVKLNQRHIDHVQSVLTAVSPDDPTPALVVFVGAYKRVARKYSSFAYKLLHLDAGVASSQFLLVAAALSVPVESISEWHSAGLGAALALRSLQEIPTQVFRLATSHEPRHASTPVRIGRGDVGITSQGENLSPQELANLSSELLVEQLIRANQIVSARLPTRIEPIRSLLTTRLLRWISGAVRGEETLGGALNRRSSTRRFSERVPQGNDIRAILQAALVNNVLLDSLLRITILVQRSSDLTPGVYAYDPATASLTRKREAFSRERTGQLFFQPGYENTPIIVWISGDVRKAASSHDAGYQTLLVRSGVLGHRLWMASLGLGLSGVLLAGITSEAPTKSGELIDEHHTSLLAFLCGYSGTEDEGTGASA